MSGSLANGEGGGESFGVFLLFRRPFGVFFSPPSFFPRETEATGPTPFWMVPPPKKRKQEKAARPRCSLRFFFGAPWPLPRFEIWLAGTVKLLSDPMRVEAPTPRARTPRDDARDRRRYRLRRLELRNLGWEGPVNAKAGGELGGKAKGGLGIFFWVFFWDFFWGFFWGAWGGVEGGGQGREVNLPAKLSFPVKLLGPPARCPFAIDFLREGSST